MIRALAPDEWMRMTPKELVYRFELRLDSGPEQLWPLVSDTNRFNRDAGLPALDELGVGDNARRQLRLTRLGVGIEWEEEPFEWVSPRRFSVVRHYTRGPIAWMRTTATLDPRHDGGTTLVYEVEARPRGPLGRPAAALQVGPSAAGASSRSSAPTTGPHARRRAPCQRRSRSSQRARRGGSRRPRRPWSAPACRPKTSIGSARS